MSGPTRYLISYDGMDGLITAESHSGDFASLASHITFIEERGGHGVIVVSECDSCGGHTFVYWDGGFCVQNSLTPFSDVSDVISL